MTHQIRPARPEEAAALSAVAEAAYGPYVERIGRRPIPMEQDFVTDIEAGHVLVAGEPPLGFIVSCPKGDALLIENIAVSPDAKGLGLGRRLMQAAEDAGRAAGFSKAILYTNALMTENLTLYPHLGWRETDRRREHGFDRVYFEKAL